MADNLDDPLWPHFHLLWDDLQNTLGQQIFIAGGYGLFLKQIWALHTGIQTLIPLARWRDAKPRVTKDVDLVTSVDLIAEEKSNHTVLLVLKRHGFEVAQKPEGKRWQFEKRFGKDRNIIVELHAPPSKPSRSDVKADRMRVKHKPSLGEAGVHGRTNPEAVGCEIQPTQIQLNEKTFSILNPVTLSVMKLTAMRDRWEDSQDQSKSQRLRDFSQLQAIKHAQDVCRVIALVTPEERDVAGEVAVALRHQLPFQSAASIVDSHFRSDRNPAALSARNNWRQEDIVQIDKMLDHWYR